MPSNRPTIMGTRHVIAAGHYLAAHAGFQILEAGGNAVDAGVCAGICLGVLQTALYAGLFFIAAHVVSRGVARIGEPPLRVAAVGTAVFLLFASAQLPIYETPLSSTRLHSNLWHLFE